MMATLAGRRVKRGIDAMVPTIWPVGRILPPPRESIAEERLYRKQRLAGALRIFARFGFDMGGAGHITVRDPGDPDSFWVNPYTLPFGHIRVSDLLLVDHQGKVVEGSGRLNRAAFAIHARLHAARPDVLAAAHSHSIHGKTWSTLGRTLDPLTQDSCAFYQDHAVYSDFSGVVTGTDEGDRIAAALGEGKAVILQNHGILTVGGSIESAVWRYLGFENACQVQLAAEAAGTPLCVPHDVAVKARGQVGSEISGIYGFKPYWDQVVRDEPDLFD
jgi:ribulose-5-phosphate 4-epimerase/fuculose-1-phosphate aldolase